MVSGEINRPNHRVIIPGSIEVLKWMLLFGSSFDEIHIPIGRKGVGDLDTGDSPPSGS
jgi:hypothetical protein